MAAKKEKLTIEKPSDQRKKKNNQLVMIAAGATVILVLLVMKGLSGGFEARTRPPPKQNVEFAPLSEADWVVNAQLELSQAQDQLNEIRSENEALRERQNQQTRQIDRLLEALDKQGKSVAHVESEAEKTLESARRMIEEAKADQERLRRSVAESAEGLRTRSRVRTDPATGETSASPPVRSRPPSVVDGVVVPPRAPRGQTTNSNSESPAMARPSDPGQTIIAPGQRVIQESSGGMGAPLIVVGVSPPLNKDIEKARLDAAAATETFEENEYAGFLPAGSFIAGVAIHGFEAGASEYTRSNPQPVIMRLDGNAITPGDGKYRLDACSAIGNSYGDLSTERAYVRISRVSCMDVKRGLVLEAAVEGFVVDSDGTQGLRGTVVRRNGQVIAKGLIAGIAEGVAGVAGVAAQASAQSVTTPITGATGVSSTNIDVGLLGEAGAFGGIRNSAQMMSEYFINEAQQIFPAIQVPTGRKVTVVFLRGTALKWESYAGVFKKVVSPQ